VHGRCCPGWIVSVAVRVRNPRVTESLPATAVCEPLSEWTVRDDGVQQDKKRGKLVVVIMR
jgi:hypothetical protein